MTKITNEVKAAAAVKAFRMQIGTYSRLKVADKISDIVISPTSSGVWFFDEPRTIGQDIVSKIIGFVPYSNL